MFVELVMRATLGIVQFHSKKFYCSPYEESKVLADEVAQEAMQQGVPIIALYPGMIYGPGKLTKGNSLAEIVMDTLLLLSVSLSL